MDIEVDEEKIKQIIEKNIDKHEEKFKSVKTIDEYLEIQRKIIMDCVIEIISDEIIKMYLKKHKKINNKTN